MDWIKKIIEETTEIEAKIARLEKWLKNKQLKTEEWTNGFSEDFVEKYVILQEKQLKHMREYRSCLIERLKLLKTTIKKDYQKELENLLKKYIK